MVEAVEGKHVYFPFPPAAIPMRSAIADGAVVESKVIGKFRGDLDVPFGERKFFKDGVVSVPRKVNVGDVAQVVSVGADGFPCVRGADEHGFAFSLADCGGWAVLRDGEANAIGESGRDTLDEIVNGLCFEGSRGDAGGSVGAEASG